MLGDVEVEDTPPMVCKDDQDEEGRVSERSVP